MLLFDMKWRRVQSWTPLDHILKFHLLFQLHRRHHQILVTLLHVAVMLFVIEVVVHACLDISVMLILDADMSVQPMANVHLLVPAKEENVLIPVLEPVVLWQYVQWIIIYLHVRVHPIHQEIHLRFAQT